MPLCEKCFARAGVEAGYSGKSMVDVYFSIFHGRLKNKEPACTPEEQCGDLHVMGEWSDLDGGQRSCACGQRTSTDKIDYVSLDDDSEEE